MWSKVKNYIEPNKKLAVVEKVLLVLLLLGSAISFFLGFSKVNANYGDIKFVKYLDMQMDEDSECDEDSSVCEIRYENDDSYLVKQYSYEEYEKLDTDAITAYEYETDNGVKLYFDHENPTEDEIQNTYHSMEANSTMPIFNLGTSLLILSVSLMVVYFFSKAFTTYEKCWFMSIMVLATIFAVLFPEESANGVNGIVIMLLYLLDTFLNILCELLISKQSKNNFLVSIAVEITEIAICLILMYRFATIATTLFFWLPIDILSYINWSKHEDDEEEELTVVRRLKGWQEVLILVGVAVWTIVVGYFLSGLDIQTDFLNGNEQLETIIIYIDACASAVGVCNGLFIFFRLREQWIAWYIDAVLEAIINILSGQYVLLVLKLGYITNTTYGYIKWSKYIKSHKEEKNTLF